MAEPPLRRVLILGADGFIGRHLAFGLRDDGWAVIASARRTTRLAEMGFDTLTVDLADPACHDPSFWSPHVEGLDAVVIAAGLLSGSEAQMAAVHQQAPRALYAACGDGPAKLLISAIGIDTADTPFARHRRAGEAAAKEASAMILRPGLVLADTSYGGSSLLRALSALPFRRPVVGDGQQEFNPIHAADLTQVVGELLSAPLDSTPRAIGGPEVASQDTLGATYRRWLGLAPAKPLRLPVPLALALGRMGDALRLGPISQTAVRQLQAGVLAPTHPDLLALSLQPRGVSAFVNARPAGTQDLWHARLYLARPGLRLVLALLWLASALLGLFLPADQFLPLVPGWPDALMVTLARLGGLVDLGIALALLVNWRPQLLTWVQLGMVMGYTLAFTFLAPALWLLPLGGLLKNLPILALIAVNGLLVEER